ncbi:MAG: GAF domain-containing protein, partial [Verrucomicrobiota bacterium]
MKPGLSSLRTRFVGLVLLSISPAVAFLFLYHQLWAGLAVIILALAAAWFGSARLILRPVQALIAATQQLRDGDLTVRSGLAKEPGEIGQLAESFDIMAASLGEWVEQRKREEQQALNRALQQTAVAALGQFALTSSDFGALLSQAATLVSQTLEVQFCRILELLPDGQKLLLRAGVGWNQGIVGIAVIDADPRLQAGFTLQSGEPVVITDLRKETRFSSDPLLGEHRIVSGVSVAIAARGQTFGVLAVYSNRQREFNSEDLQFLLAVANALAVSVEQSRAEFELKKIA